MDDATKTQLARLRAAEMVNLAAAWVLEVYDLDQGARKTLLLRELASVAEHIDRDDPLFGPIVEAVQVLALKFEQEGRDKIMLEELALNRALVAFFETRYAQAGAARQKLGEASRSVAV